MAKKRGYHHGDLRRALLTEAVRIIHTRGVDALTLRAVGHKLGVSRTAMYRHFADKTALLGAVASEGFRMLRLQLTDAWEQGGADARGFEAMGAAYVRFALSHPSHYRVMFGGHIAEAGNTELEREGAGAFQALVDALLALQASGVVRREDPLRLAQFIWATVHGIAMLAIDGMLDHRDTNIDGLVRFANERLRAAISV